MIIHRIIINIHDDATTNIITQDYPKELEKLYNKSETEIKISQKIIITDSFQKYNLFYVPKNSEICRLMYELLPNKCIKIIFEGNEFSGKLDPANKRIYCLKELMQFSKRNNYNFLTGHTLTLILDKEKRQIEVKMNN